MTEDGLCGLCCGVIGLCGLKTLDRLRSPAGDGGTFARVSIVLSESDCLGFLGIFKDDPLATGEVGVEVIGSDSSLLWLS